MNTHFMEMGIWYMENYKGRDDFNGITKLDIIDICLEPVIKWT